MMIVYVLRTEPVDEMLKIVGDNLGDLTEPLTEVGKLGLEDARAQIDSQGTLMGGGSWPDMSPWTGLVSRVLYGRDRDPGKLLKAEGGLLSSLAQDGPNNIFEVEPMEGVFGSRYSSARSGYPIAAGQQAGTEKTFHVLQGEGFSETGYPGREFVMWNTGRVDEYDRIFADHVVKGLE